MQSDFNRCCDCSCSSHQIIACGGCPRAFPTTEPGELAPLREERSVAGTGLVIAVAITFGGICLGSLLAMLFNGVAK